MTMFDNILDAQHRARQLDPAALLAEIEAENEGDSFEPGVPVGHADFADFRGVVESVKDGKVRVRVVAGWRGTLPRWPVSIPHDKLVEV